MKHLFLAAALLSLALSLQAKQSSLTLITSSVNDPLWKKSEVGTWV